MKAKQTILNNIKKELNLSNDDSVYFFEWVKEYIKAIQENRMICNIEHVSSSGMSRYITFNYLEKSKYDKKKYNLLNTYFIFKSLGYRYNKKYAAFYISGCGMDMIFHTNYENIHTFKRLGFLSEKECQKLSQNTPVTI